MMHNSTDFTRRARPGPIHRTLPLLAILLAMPALAAAPDEHAARNDTVVPLDEFVVSASRSLQDPWFTPSAVTRLDLEELDEIQIGDLRAALAREPGVDILETGAAGSQASIFLRGAASHQTLLIVDGVRMNDRSASYANFLGGAGLSGVGRLEVLRGPQSTLYGSSAMGGVVLLETTRARDGTSGSLSVSGGSFGTAGGAVSIAHGSGRFGATGALARSVSSNDRDRNHFKHTSFAGRLEGRPLDQLLVGLTYRADRGDYEEPGSLLFPAPGVAESRNHLATAYAEAHLTDSLATRVTAGLHRRDYTFSAAWGSSSTRNTRKIVDVQNNWSATKAVECIFGLNYERSRYEINTEASRDELLGGYVSLLARAAEGLTLTAGARYDDYDSAGGADTWRLGVSWLALPRTKFRATLGTGFSAPGSDDRFGVVQWGQRANPELRPEESRGWDIGVDHEMLEGRLTASATWFRNEFRDLFEWETVDFTTFEGRVVNRARASTEGLELALAARIGSAVRTRLAYTYLEARNDSDDVRLIRRPRHAIDAEVNVQPARVLFAGAGLHLVADRTDTTGELDDYATVRLHAGWSVGENLLARLRIENALDKTYEEVPGYPALPRGLFANLEWTF